MKNKVLLMGKSNTILDDFFIHLGDTFELMTTSCRYNDILNHLKYFNPDIVVYCMSIQSKEDINVIISIKRHIEKADIPLAVIGSEEECNEFLQYTVNIADLVITKPVTASSIMKKITEHIQEQKQNEEENPSKEEQSEYKSELPKKHILVVDDDPLMLKLIREYLKDCYDVATAPSGKVALKFLEKKKTDLILLDYQMPVDDGPAVLEKLHANDDTKNIPVVFLTGITEREKIQKALVLRPNGYLLKPIDRDKLIEVIAKLIG